MHTLRIKKTKVWRVIGKNNTTHKMKEDFEYI